MRRVFAAVPAVLALMALVPSIHAVEGEVGAPGLALNLGGKGKSPRTLGVRLGSKAMSGTGAEVFRMDEAMPGLKRVRRKWETFHLRERPVRGSLHAFRVDAKAEQGLELQASLVSREQFVEITGVVLDKTGGDRALVVSFVLPVRTAGAVFENTLRQRFKLSGKETVPSKYEDTRHVGRFNGLRHSNHAFTCLNFGDRAVAMAYPLHAPRIFLMKATPDGYVMEFHLGVCRATEKFVSRAGFRFILYAVDPKWGIRDAAAKYYAFFGELFASRAKRHGNWGETGRMAQAYGKKNPEDFAFQFGLVDVQWTEGKMYDFQVELMKRTGCYTFHHREPWAWWHDQRDYEKKPPDEPYGPVRKQTNKQELAEIRKQAAGEIPIKQGTNQLCSCPPRLAAQAAVNSYCVGYGETKNDGNQDLSLMRGLGWSYGCSQIGMNLDPELPKPNRAQIAEQWQFRFFFKWKNRGVTDPHGISWDSLTDWTLWRWINFRREHFATTDNPLVYSPRDARLGQLMGFQHVEFAKYFSEKIHDGGGMVYVNTNAKEILYAAPYVDAFGVESSLDNKGRYTFEVLSMLRCAAFQKPISFYKASQTAEAGIRRGVLFAIFPGVAGVREDQRTLYRKYMPALKACGEAGWEPVTAARCDAADVLIERFGGNATSPRVVYFTLYNASARPATATVTLEADRLAGGPFQAVRELIQKRAVRWNPSARSIVLDIGATEALVLEVRRRGR